MPQRDDFLWTQVDDTLTRIDQSDAWLGKRAGYSGATISQCRSGIYPGKRKEVETAIRKVLDDVRAELHVVNAKYQFIDFELHRRTTTYMELAKAGNYLIVLVGPAGIGKTQSAEEFYRARHSVVYEELTPDGCSGAGLIRRLKALIGARRNPPEINTDTQAVFQKIREERLTIILDQAHELLPSGIKMVFALRRATKRPIILIANESLLRLIEGVTPEEMKDREQHASRVGLVPVYAPPYTAKDQICAHADDVPAHWFSREELKRFLAMYPIKFEKAFFNRCRQIADGPGHLRALDDRLKIVMQLIDDLGDVGALDEAEKLVFKMHSNATFTADDGEGE